jgi:hypothetical protein
MPKVEKTCTICGETYVAADSASRTRQTCSKSCAMKLRVQRNGGKPYNWKGGRWVINTGYVKVKVAEPHPRADGRGYVLEHLLVMEKTIGRPVEAHETVHHKNGDRQDNRPENLELHVGRHARGATIPHCSTCTCFEH